MTHKAPGKHYRKGITLLELAKMFPDEEAARAWFEGLIWPNGNRYCPRCGSRDTYECSHAKMPYRCRDCGKYFSVKTGTLMAGSPLPLLKWVYAIYLDLTSLKGVSSMKLHRDLGIGQKAAWYMQQRIREAFVAQSNEPGFGPKIMTGPAEVDETYMGGLERNKHASEKLKAGRGTVGKTPIVAAKDRTTGKVSAEVVSKVDAPTLQGFVTKQVAKGVTVYTDENAAYRGMPHEHKTVNHSVGEYVDEMIHTNGVESFWSMLKRAHKGTFHKMSPKHLQRYVNEFAGRHNIRELDTIEQMAVITSRLDGKHLPYRELIKPNGLSSGAQPGS